MKETQCWFLKNRRKTMLVFQINTGQKPRICPSPCDCEQRWSFRWVQSLLVLVCKQSFALFLVPELLIHLKVYRSNNLCGDYLRLSSIFCTMPFKCPSMPFQIAFLYDKILKGMPFQMPFQIIHVYLKGHLKGHALQYYIIQKGNLKGHWRAFDEHCAKNRRACPLK